MKKTLLLILASILALTCVGCSGDTQTITTTWSYEKLTYKVMETGNDTVGTLTITAECIIDETEYLIPQINEDKTVSEVSVSLAVGSHILEGKLEFGDDVMEYKTITTSGFRPLYSFKSLVIGAEKSAYTKEGDVPSCFSYIMTTAYDRSSSSANSAYLRRAVYGENGWDGTYDSDNWSYYAQEFTDIPSPFCDVNQIYYMIRSLNDITDEDFSYNCYVPMILEINTKRLYCTSETVTQSVNSVPYISEIATNYKPDYSLAVTKVTIVPQESNVAGKGIEVYYANSPIYSREQLEAGAYTQSGTTFDGLKKVPVIVKENIDSTGNGNQNGRGTISYVLTDISNERPVR